MTSRVDKSLEEIWEIKERIYREFKESGYEKYHEYVNNEVKDFKRKYNIKSRRDVLGQSK